MRLILYVLTWLSLLAMMMSCDRECACLNKVNCNFCKEHNCGCSCCDIKKAIVIEAVLPDGSKADSYCLHYDGHERKFYGTCVTVTSSSEYLDLLMFNNDGEATIVSDDGVASTNLVYGSDSIRHQPTPFYSLYLPHTYVYDKDTVAMHLEQRVFEYEIEIELRNNDGRLSDIVTAIISGMTSNLDILTNELSGNTSYASKVQSIDSIYAAKVLSFGPSNVNQYLGIIGSSAKFRGKY